jgi:hypothetical protein
LKTYKTEEGYLPDHQEITDVIHVREGFQGKVEGFEFLAVFLG